MPKLLDIFFNFFFIFSEKSCGLEFIQECGKAAVLVVLKEDTRSSARLARCDFC